MDFKLILEIFVVSIIFFQTFCEAQYTPSSACMSSFITAMITRHNQLRSLHGVGNLTEDLVLDKSAQEYAEKLAATRKLVHSSKNFGENLAYYMNSQYSDSAYYCEKVGIFMTNFWYNELYKPGYNYSNPGFQPKTGHFTQLVWKATTNIGVGIAIYNVTNFYGVAQYTPQGNFYYIGFMAEAFQQNVPKPLI